MPDPSPLNFLINQDIFPNYIIDMINNQKYQGNNAPLDLINLLQNQFEILLKHLWHITRCSISKFPALITENFSKEYMQHLLSKELNSHVTIDEFLINKKMISSNHQLSLGNKNLILGTNIIIGSSYYEQNSTFKISLYSCKHLMPKICDIIKTLFSSFKNKIIIIENIRPSEPMYLSRNARIYQTYATLLT